MLSHDQSRLTPPGIRRKYLERVKNPENLVGNARKSLMAIYSHRIPPIYHF